MQLPLNLSNFVLATGQGQSLSLLGSTITCKVTSASTGGAWSLVEYMAPPYWAGPAVHWHTRTTEAFYVLDGTLALTLDDKTSMIGKGACVVVPPGVRHTFFNPTASPVCYLAWFSPGGFEQYWEELGTLIAAQPYWPPADTRALQELGRKYDQYDAMT